MTALLAAFAAQAKPVSRSVAQGVALRYFPSVVDMTPKGWSEIYLFVPESGSGFVLVSADDCAVPVLGYSESQEFDTAGIPSHVASWIEGYRQEIAALRSTGDPPAGEVLSLWNAPKGGDGGGVPPLMTTQWSQSPYYNSRCPFGGDGSSRVVTGCVATAMAQVMKYWNHPYVGHGSHTYTARGIGQLHVDFDTAYRWSRMPDKLTGRSSSVAVAAVAQLMYHVGVSVSMNYGVSSSGAQVQAHGSSTAASAENALKDYFRYSPSLRGVTKERYSDAAWDALMQQEIDHKRPVLYTGYDMVGGHAFVLDGYSFRDGRQYFHVNWGWSGYYDGYFTLDALSPGGGGTGGNATYTFNLKCEALIGIRPSGYSPDDSLSTVQVSALDPATGSVSGSGRYGTYRETAFIEATAAEGYRFAGWSSGAADNPLEFIVNGDFSDTAVFVPVSGDTLGYSTDGLHSTWYDAGRGRTDWGIRLPASVRTPQSSLQAVQLYVFAGGTYIVNIYQGDRPDAGTLVHSQSVFLRSAMDWVTLPLDTAVFVDNYSPLWVTFTFRDNGFAAARAPYSGSLDGTWYRTNAGWTHFSNGSHRYAWMIRALFDRRADHRFRVDVEAAMWDSTAVDPACGVTGAGVYHEDSVATLTAIAPAGLKFLYWVGSQGDTVRANPYSYHPAANEMYTAVFGPSSLGVASASAGLPTVKVHGRTIVCQARPGEPVALFDLQGRRLASLPGGGRLETPAPGPGVYIVRAGPAACKVVVR